jgi:uncharacterized phage protein (TIGR01671 family)
MREIKFRAWDLISKKMVQVIHFYNHNDVYPDYIFMQYTGLKDANGKEVYEGDVVNLGDTGRAHTGIASIVWHGAGFSINQGKYKGWLGKDIASNCQIIGNLF